MNNASQEDIKMIFSNNEPAVLYFYTPLCGTCQVAGKMLSIVEQMIPEIPFSKADLNYLPGIAETYFIESVPCLLVIKDGLIQEKIYAFKSVPYLYDLIKQYILK